VLNNINFQIDSPELFSIVGPVGSGKTSLLMTILGEIESIKGNMKIDGSVFFVPQEPYSIQINFKAFYFNQL
jgi:ABC-type multidrug transport system ATPase subunit